LDRDLRPTFGHLYVCVCHFVAPCEILRGIITFGTWRIE
jgi:hypothetical protein